MSNDATPDGVSGVNLNRRGFLALAGATMALPALAACGGGSGSSSAGGKTTVVVSSWHWKEAGGMQAWWAQMKKDFEAANPNITIEDRYVPYNNYFNQAYVELGSGNPADIYSVGQPANFVMMANKLVEPLDSYLEGTTYKQDYAPVIDSPPCSLDGQTYVLPMNQLTGAYLYYDTDLLEKGGLEVPTTLDEYVAVARALNSPPGRYGALLDTSTTDALYQQLLLATMAHGGLWWDRATPKTPTVNTPQVVDAMTWYKGMITDGLVPKGADYISHNQRFSEGRGAMMWNGTFSMPQIKNNNPELAKRVGIASLPWANGQTYLSVLGCVMARGSKVKDEAWEFLKFIGSRENQQRFVELTGTPTSFALPSTPELTAAVPALEVFRKPVTTEPVIYRVPFGMEAKAAQYFKTVTDGAQKFLYGGADIKSTLDGVQRQLEDLAKSS